VCGVHVGVCSLFGFINEYVMFCIYILSPSSLLYIYTYIYICIYSLDLSLLVFCFLYIIMIVVSVAYIYNIYH